MICPRYCRCKSWLAEYSSRRHGSALKQRPAEFRTSAPISDFYSTHKQWSVCYWNALSRTRRTLMLRNAATRKSGPLPACDRATSRNASHHHRSIPRHGKQPVHRESKKSARARVILPTRFYCEYCQQFTPWRRLGSFDPAYLCTWCLHHGARGPQAMRASGAAECEA